MATTDMTVTPATLEKIERNNSNLRRNSTGNFYIEPTASKVLPHYLQASSHSCHDSCKFGNININTYETKTKARNPFPPRFSVTPDKSYYLAGTPNVVPINRKPVTTPKPSRDGKSQVQLNKYEAVKKEIPRSLKKVDAFQKQVFEKKVIDLKPLQMKSSPLSPSKPVIRRHSNIILPSKGLGAKEVRPLGSPSSRRNVETGISKDINSPKTSKKSQLGITASTSPKARVKTFLTKNAGNVQSPRKVSSSITKQKSLRRVGPTKKPVEEEVPEKTLYVVEPSVEKKSNISLPSPKSDKGSTKGVRTPQSPERKEDREINLLDQKTENKQRPIKVGKMTSDDGDCSPRNLKFKKGKVVTVWMESSIPRKLKFRPVKVLTESQNSRAADETRVGRVKRLISEDEFNGGSNKAESESPKVVLRHQDVEGKKDAQSLFNNVIEETASKLVETRKSKVKALVGAFESLISIQDIKLPDNTK